MNDTIGSGPARREREVGAREFHDAVPEGLIPEHSEHVYRAGRVEIVQGLKSYYLFEPPDWRDDVVPGMVFWDGKRAWTLSDRFCRIWSSGAGTRLTAGMPAVLAPGDILRDPRKVPGE